MSGDWQQQAMRRLREMQSRGGAGGAGGPRLPRGSAAPIVGGVALVGAYLFFSNALFNVDGGHRAIKYQRLGGVSSEIFNEGRSLRCPWRWHG